MIYGYIRVSTDKQTVENQRFEINNFCRLGNDINSKVLAFAFGLSAEIERNLISQRTKEALARKRDEGVILGRPKGSKSVKVKLSGKETKILTLLNSGCSISEIARKLKVSRTTASGYIRKMGWH